ncbi:MAG: hypothetical protein LBR83_09695, partial [Clostridiales bacterium]|nr:hypothetical protein [Clostridiales bacterium]
EELRENLNAGKGEYAGVIHIKTEGAGAAETNAGPSPSLEAQLVDIMVKADVSLKTAVRTLYESNRARLAKKDVYGASLNIKGLLNG